MLKTIFFSIFDVNALSTQSHKLKSQNFTIKTSMNRDKLGWFSAKNVDRHSLFLNMENAKFLLGMHLRSCVCCFLPPLLVKSENQKKKKKIIIWKLVLFFLHKNLDFPFFFFFFLNYANTPQLKQLVARI